MSESKTRTECVEMICKQGCNVVRGVITQLEQNQSVSELQHLNSADRLKVLKELKEIMDVYDKPDD